MDIKSVPIKPSLLNPARPHHQESKQAEMWDKINQKEAEQVALTAADRRRLETAKDEVNQEIRLLEEKMELAEMVSWFVNYLLITC